MVVVVKQQQQAMASLQCLSGVFWQHQKAADELYYTGHWGDLLHTDTVYNNALTQTGLGLVMHVNCMATTSQFEATLAPKYVVLLHNIVVAATLRLLE